MVPGNCQSTEHPNVGCSHSPEGGSTCTNTIYQLHTYIQVRGKKTMVQMMVKYMDACEYDLFPTTSKTVSSFNRPRLAGNSVNSFSRIDSTCRVRQSPTWHPPKTEIRHVIYTCRPKRRILKTFFSLLLTVSGISARWFLSMLSISSDFM